MNNTYGEIVNNVKNLKKDLSESKATIESELENQYEKLKSAFIDNNLNICFEN